MKRIMVFWLVLLFPIIGFAKEYESKDINVKLDVNDEYIVITRDNVKNNKDLEKFNLTEEQMVTIMNNGSIYFDIVKNDISYEILVVVPEITLPIKDLVDVNDEVLNTFKEEATKKVGANTSSLYRGKYNFIVVDYYDKDTDCYIMNYYTVVNSKGYNIQLQKKTSITEDEKNSLKQIVDSVTFKDQTNTKEIVEEEVSNNNFDIKKLLLALGIGLVAGIITYGIGLIIIKKKSSK
jgi:hypothetical protein